MSRGQASALSLDFLLQEVVYLCISLNVVELGLLLLEAENLLTDRSIQVNEKLFDKTHSILPLDGLQNVKVETKMKKTRDN